MKFIPVFNIHKQVDNFYIVALSVEQLKIQ